MKNNIKSFSCIFLNTLMICYFLCIGMSGLLCSSTVYFILSIILMLLIVHIIFTWFMLNNEIVDPYIIFVISAFFFSSAHVVLYLLGVVSVQYGSIEYKLIHYNYNHITIIKYYQLLFLSFYMTHIGALHAYKNVKFKIIQLDKIIHKSAVIVSLFFIVISLPANIILIKNSVKIVNQYGYFGLYNMVDYENKSLYSVLAPYIMPGLFFCIASTEKKALRVIAIIFVLLYSSIYFYLGSRSTAIMPVIGLLILWNKIINKIKFSTILIFSILVIFFIFPFVKYIRDVPSNERFTLTYSEIFKDKTNPIIYSIFEMGYSANIICKTIELVPSNRDYDLGKSYMYSLFTLFPNLFWVSHPSSDRALGKWFVWEVSPETAEIGGGYGFSYIAEAYLNFGLYPSIIFFFLLGYMIVVFKLWVESDITKIRYAVCASFYSLFLLYVRGESASLLRKFFWYSMIPYIAIIIIYEFCNKKYIKK